MSEIVSLATEPRTKTGSHANHQLRKKGRIPAVIYGHKEANVLVSVDADLFGKAVRIKHARVLDLQVAGKVEKVLIRELQFDYLGKELIHADFERVSADEKVKVTIPVKLKNTPKTMGGGVIDQPLHALHVECPAFAIPDEVVVDIFALTVGNPIHVRELTLPEGVVAVDGPEMVVVQLKIPGAEAADTTAPAEGAGPEVIKKEKKTEDDE